jgi:hypothetical protein
MLFDIATNSPTVGNTVGTIPGVGLGWGRTRQCPGSPSARGTAPSLGTALSTRQSAPRPSSTARSPSPRSPRTPGGCVAQQLSVAASLCCWCCSYSLRVSASHSSPPKGTLQGDTQGGVSAARSLPRPPVTHTPSANARRSVPADQVEEREARRKDPHAKPQKKSGEGAISTQATPGTRS